MQRWMVILAGVVVAVVVGAATWLTLAGSDGSGDENAVAIDTLTSSSGSGVSVPPSVSSTVVDVAVAVSTLPDRSEVADSVGEPPSQVELPSPDDTVAVVAFLSSEGAGLVVFVAETGGLYALDVGDVAVCERFASELDSLIESPVVLSDLATRVPDPVTSELFVSDIALKVRLLGSCGAEDAVGTSAEVAWQSELLERRLTELGVEW